MENKKIKVAAYCRVGNAEQLEDKLSIQKEALHKYANDNNLAIVNSYEDVGSGINPNRAGLSRLMADYKAGAFDAVLVEDRARLTRSAIQNAQLPFNVLSIN